MNQIETLPAAHEAAFTMKGEIPVQAPTADDQASMPAASFTAELIDQNIEKIKAEEMGHYGDVDGFLYAAMDHVSLKGKDVLLIGSNNPWYESVCLAHDCESCTVVGSEATDFEYPKLAYKSFDDIANQPFDVIVSISSIQRSGIGQDDEINPNADVHGMRLMKKHLRPDGRLLLVLPIGNDLLIWNTQRVYGFTRLPYLFNGWTLQGAVGFDEKKLTEDNTNASYQPLFILAPNFLVN